MDMMTEQFTEQKNNSAVKEGPVLFVEHNNKKTETKTLLGIVIWNLAED